MTSERQRRIAQRLAAERRRQAHRRRLSWLAAAVILVVLASAVTIAVVRRPQQAAASGSGEPTPAATTGGGTLGPEGIPSQTGAPLASLTDAASGSPVDKIRCEAAEQVAYHIHTHLAVFVNGASRSIPYGVGVVAPAVTQTAQGPFAEATRCYYWLHTHAGDGIIHVESPTSQHYTLGNFFDIWGQPLTGQRVGPATGTVTAYVNGRRYAADPRSIVLAGHEDIQLDVGTPVVPPEQVDWSSSQL
jgi:hypothetical protein